jgi:hypothetical protein
MKLIHRMYLKTEIITQQNLIEMEKLNLVS